MKSALLLALLLLSLPQNNALCISSFPTLSRIARSRTGAPFRPRHRDKFHFRASSVAEARSVLGLTRRKPKGLTHSLATCGFAQKLAASVVLFLGLATVAFRNVCGWSWSDSLYFVTTTATTVGYGDLPDIALFGKILACALSVLGTGMLGCLTCSALDEYRRARESDRALEECTISYGSEYSFLLKSDVGALRDAWLPWKIASWWLRRFCHRVGLWTQMLFAPSYYSSCERTAWRYLAETTAKLLALVSFGGLGWWGIECGATGRISLSAALYGTLMTVTTVGLGDVVPTTSAGRLYVSALSLVGSVMATRTIAAAAVLPLEAAREAARAEQRSAYGQVLDAQTLAELSAGTLVKALGLSSDDTCITRDEFTLLLLVRQGLVAASDLEACREKFDALDLDQSGSLHI